jgi:hypothetical protein
MEWLEAIKTAFPLFGPVGALLLGLLIWEKMEHSKTRAALQKSQEARVSEASSLTAVVTGSNQASAARDSSQRDVASALQTLTAAVNQALLLLGGRR